MHTITTNTQTGLIEVEVRGFWSLEHIAGFVRDITAQAASVRAKGRQQVVLYDYFQAAIQSQDVVAALQSLARDDAFRSRKVALFTESKMARTQAARIAAAGHKMRVFDNRASALAWLYED